VTAPQAASSADTAPAKVPAVWGSVPQRNKNFTGREELLVDLRQRLITSGVGDVTAVLAHAIHGMGGVGKTQLAIEYAYRHAGDYEAVWWIPADQIALVRASLAALSPRLGLGDVAPGRVEDAVSAVLDALRQGEPYKRWLLVFDNADQPEEIRDLVPIGSGHVIITSRNHRWQSTADVVEVDVFVRRESLDFLSRRVPGITPSEAARLAEELGDLPLALEQAGALQAEAGMSADEYLELLAKESSRVLAENPPADYPVPVAAAWSLSMARLKEQMPVAWELLRRFAFFGPQPIRRGLLKHGKYVLGPPLQAPLGDPIMVSRATRELGRYALARVDNHRRTLQVHRLIQKLVRDELDPHQAKAVRHEVHLLLAEDDPDDPDGLDNWPHYEDLLAHVIPSEAVTSTHPDVRRLIRNLVRYLFNIGDLKACDTLSRDALERWTADSGPDDVDVLVLSGQRANLLWTRGAYQDAFDLRSATLERMRAVLGEEHEATLLVTNDHGADLRALGEFTRALELDQRTLSRSKTVFGDDHPRTFMAANNLALDQGLNGDYEAALRTDTRTRQDRVDFYGRDDHPWVIHSLSAMGRDLRQGGKYADALQTEEQAYQAFSELVRQRTLSADHTYVLQQAKDLSIARRMMGLFKPALELAEQVYDRFVASHGEKQPDALSAAMNLGNARRAYGDSTGNAELVVEAGRQIKITIGHYGEVYSEDHPYTLGCAINLAVVRRSTGDLIGGRDLLENALAGLQRRLGHGHHYTLICMTTLATSLSDTGDVERAREFGERALNGLRRLVGADHPHTLACAANLVADLKALGEVAESGRLASETFGRYRNVLPVDHPNVANAEKGERIVLDFEPLPL
jgi:tetratricopeptide (TPR) repeat protein